jgi:phenol 2-monooxygenase
MSVTYAPSELTAEAKWQSLAAGFPIGARFHSASVVRLADAKPVELGHTVLADARWHVFVFCPGEDPAAEGSAIRKLCRFLGEAPDSPVLHYTPSGEDIDSVIDVRAVFQQNHRELALDAMPAFLLPQKGRLGLMDYEKMFCADPGDGRDIFEIRGIDRRQGCIVVVRPDQYVANVLPIDAHDELAGFFSGFMTPAGGAGEMAVAAASGM